MKARLCFCSSFPVLASRTANLAHSSFADIVVVPSLDAVDRIVFPVCADQSRRPDRLTVRTIWPHRAVALARTRDAHQSKQHGAEESSQPVCEHSGRPIRKRVERRNHDSIDERLHCNPRYVDLT